MRLILTNVSEIRPDRASESKREGPNGMRGREGMDSRERRRGQLEMRERKKIEKELNEKEKKG